MIYAIFYEFIRKTIESASLKNGEKLNCVHAEALCTTCWRTDAWMEN